MISQANPCDKSFKVVGKIISNRLLVIYLGNVLFDIIAPGRNEMKLKYIKPFIESVYDFFVMMLNSKAEKGEIGLRGVERATYEITSLIGLSGVARGSVALSFPLDTAVGIANRLLGSDYRDLNKQVTDAVAESVNIVAGSAKSKFFKGAGRPIDLSLPNVVIGKNYTVSYPSMSVWLEVPFSSELGAFSMRVTFEMNEIQQ